jgi:HTH domain
MRHSRWGVALDYGKIRDQVLEILRRRPDVALASIARELGVSRQAVYKSIEIPKAPRVPVFRPQDLSEPGQGDDAKTVPQIKAAKEVAHEPETT